MKNNVRPGVSFTGLRIVLLGTFLGMLFGWAGSGALVLFSRFPRSPFLLIKGTLCYGLAGALVGAGWWLIVRATSRQNIPVTEDNRAAYAGVGIGVTVITFELAGIALGRGWIGSQQLGTGSLVMAVGALLVGATISFALGSKLARRLFPPRIQVRLLQLQTVTLAITTLALLVGGSWAVVHKIYPRPALSPTAIQAKRLATLERHPNILMIVLDTTRFDYISSYWDKENPLFPRPTTPNIDRLAAEGVLYKNCISAAPWTYPSHGSLFTGTYPAQHGATGSNTLLNDFNLTLAELLKSVGYKTVGFSNNQPWVRKDLGMAQGFDDFYEMWLPENFRPKIMQLGMEFVLDQFAQVTGLLAQDWVEDNYDPHEPFFMFLHFMEPHHPYSSFPEYLEQFLPEDFDKTATHAPEEDANQMLRMLLENPESLSGTINISYLLSRHFAGNYDVTAPQKTLLKAHYAATIAYIDYRIGQITDDLSRRGILDDTLLIFTTDHGENMGNHRLFLHQDSLYEALVHVPLIIRFPQKQYAGTVIDQRVSNLDIFPSIRRFLRAPPSRVTSGPITFPTLLRWLKQEDPETPPPSPVRGKSLLPSDLDPTQDRLIVSQHGPADAIFRPDAYWFSKEYTAPIRGTSQIDQLKEEIRWLERHVELLERAGRGHYDKTKQVRQELAEKKIEYNDAAAKWRYLAEIMQPPVSDDPEKARQARRGIFLCQARIAGYFGEYKYIWAAGLPDELYHITADPIEAQNLALEKPEMVRKMKNKLTQWAKNTRPIGKPNKSTSTSDHTDRNLKEFGYN